MKHCIKCGIEKPLSKFNKRSDNGKIVNTCVDCKKQYDHKYHIKNRKKKTNRDLIKSYGISLQQKLQMLKKQNEKCAICEKELLIDRDKNVDHCHKTGKVRDILCCKCNFGIGYFNDSVDLLKSAQKYLEKHQKSP